MQQLLHFRYALVLIAIGLMLKMHNLMLRVLRGPRLWRSWRGGACRPPAPLGCAPSGLAALGPRYWLHSKQAAKQPRQRVLNSKPRATPCPTPKKRTEARYASFCAVAPRAAPALVLLVAMAMLTGLGMADRHGRYDLAGGHGPWRCYGLAAPGAAGGHGHADRPARFRSQ